MKTFFLSILTFLAVVCFACLNEEHVNKSGRYTSDSGSIFFQMEYMEFNRHQNIPEIEKRLMELVNEKPVTEEDILANQNSIAVCYIKLGRLEDAEKILTGLLKKYPSDYSLTINLGTLYELQGKNDKALEYIKKAVAINPDSHDGSEWFHVKVLEFKLKKIPDSAIKNADILQLKSIRDESSYIAANISYQLKERIPFTPSPDLLMAKILQEFGDFLADSLSIKGAYVIYEMGIDYDKNNILQLKERRDALLPFFKKYEEVIPVTGNYYIDNMIATADKNKIAIAKTILDKGLNYFKEQEEKRKQKERKKNYLIAAIFGIIALSGGIYFYKKKKQAAA